MDLDNQDVNRKIKSYRGREEKWYGELEKGFVEELRRISEGFVDPATGKLVTAAEFLSWLDLERYPEIFSFYNSLYEGEKWRRDYPDKAMIKSILFFFAGKFNSVKEEWAHLKEHPKDALLLEFESDNYGKPKLPTYETFRMLFNVRLAKNDNCEKFFSVFRDVSVRECKSRSVDLSKVGEDAVPLPCAKSDSEAEYSGYYKMAGWKLDILLNLNKGAFLPLEFEFLGINEDEGKCFPKSLTTLEACKTFPEEWWVDGKYATFENIARAAASGIVLHYKLAADWVVKGVTIRDITMKYHRYWREPNFIADPNFQYMLQFLVEHNHYELVASPFRDAKFAEYEEAPDSYLDVCHTRNMDEGFNGHLKEHLRVDWLTKNKKKEKVKVYAALALTTILAIALTRLQHGITKNLTSIANIIR